MYKHSHLSLNDRKIIEKSLKKRLSKKTIASLISKDATTIAKEIKKHRIFKPTNKTSNCIHFNSCDVCIGLKCPDFHDSDCSFRDRSPGVCSGCSTRNSCHRNKYDYLASHAHNQYLYSLSDSRLGINFSAKEFDTFADIIVPLLKKGQSPYHILINHPELDISLKSLYNYIEWGYFIPYGISDIDLKRKLKFKVKSDNKLKKRKEYRHYLGRNYQNFLTFLKDNSIEYYFEMDTVYNDGSNGPFIQTFVCTQTSLFFAFIHKAKTHDCMYSGIESLFNSLSKGDFIKLFYCILTDRGTEFSNPQALEYLLDNDEKLINIFYCDPMRSSQKPHIEKAHTTLREILPKSRDLSFLTQEKLNIICSHINSMPRKSLNGKTSYEMFSFIHGKDILDKLNIIEIEKDQVSLIPSLVK